MRPEREVIVVFLGWFVKKWRNSYLQFFFEPYLAEHFCFLETSGFFVVYMKPRFGLKLNVEVLVSSYFDFEEQENTRKIIDVLRVRRIKVTQRVFKTTEEFIEFAQNHPVLKQNPWVSAELDTAELRELVKDFY